MERSKSESISTICNVITTAAALLGLFQLSQWAEGNRLAKEAEIRALVPHLVVKNYCNHRKIGFVDMFDVDGNGPNRAAITLLNEDKKASEKELERMGYVAEVKNVGGGPALHCKLTWIVESATAVDGTELTKEELGFDSEFSLEPTQLRDGESGKFSWLPSCLAQDTSLRIGYVTGALQMRCSDVTGEQRLFVQSFTASTYYNPAKPGYKARGDFGNDVAEIMFHFGEMRRQDGAYAVHKSYHAQSPRPSNVKPLTQLPDYLGGWGDSPVPVSDRVTE